jgi:hypothetical protein
MRVTRGSESYRQDVATWTLRAHLHLRKYDTFPSRASLGHYVRPNHRCLRHYILDAYSEMTLAEQEYDCEMTLLLLLRKCQ